MSIRLENLEELQEMPEDGQDEELQKRPRLRVPPSGFFFRMFALGASDSPEPYTRQWVWQELALLLTITQ